MSLYPDLRHGVRIGRAEFVRSLRGYSRDKRRLLGLAFAVLFFGGNLLFSLPAVYVLAQRLQTSASIPFFEPVATLLPVGFLLIASLRTMERIGSVDSENLLLTTVHPRAVVVGLIAAEVARMTLWFGVPLAVVAGTFAVGLGSPTLLVTAGFVMLPMVCCAAVWGYAVGIGVLRILRRLPRMRRLLQGGGILAFVAIVVLSQVAGRYFATEDVPVSAVLSLVSFGPMTDYVALAFVGTPLSEPVAPVALVVFAVLVGLTPVGLALAERQAVALWFTDAPVRSSPASTRWSSDSTVSAGGFSPPRPFSWTRAGRIAWGHLVRAVRHPQDLAHLLMLFFFVGPLVGTFLHDPNGEGTALLVAGAGVLLGGYLSGASFGLNPLGDDRPLFPVLLLTETEPRTFLRGRTLAGLTLGLPFAVVVPLATVAIGTPLLYGVAFAVVGSGFCLAGAFFALGLGCSYPIYEERELWGAETVAPSTLVMMGYSFVVFGGTISGLVATWLVLAGQLAPTGVLFAGLGLYVLLSVGGPLLSYRYALQRYRRYVFE